VLEYLTVTFPPSATNAEKNEKIGQKAQLSFASMFAEEPEKSGKND
jgi:hypothetical protein